MVKFPFIRTRRYRGGIAVLIFHPAKSGLGWEIWQYIRAARNAGCPVTKPGRKSARKNLHFTLTTKGYLVVSW